ncbi:hypothetical protein G6F40_015716 [Rhizopus arrhizus]|nr:hypothetical protein G6F40_015716 [Rhizopus arrhizus]
MGATEIAIGALRDADSLASAVQGVDGIFHIGPAFTSDEAAMGIALVEAAQQSTVRKFVFSSVIQPTNTRLANHASKIPVEDALYSTLGWRGRRSATIPASANPFPRTHGSLVWITGMWRR